MSYLGINKKFSHSMNELHDGGLALIENSEIQLAIMEERISRILRLGGFDQCINYVNLEKVHAIGISTCTESCNLSSENVLIKDIPMYNIDHHVSHAICAFELSNYKDAIVVVMDGGGNTLTKASEYWWKNYRQQNSYYHVTDNSIELIDTDFTEPFALGYGELFRAMTYLLGFNTSKKSANITALASYGDYKQISTKPFISFNNGKLHNCCKYNHKNPAKSLDPIWNIIGYRFLPIKEGQEITKDYCNLCAYVQWNVEESILQKLHYIQQKVKSNNLCLSGGVALNCVLNARIIESALFKSVFIPFCAGDHGQPLGNALALMRLKNIKINHKKISPFLGTDIKPSYDELLEKVNHYLKEYDSLIIYLNDIDLQKYIANTLLDDEVILVCRGKSEYGLRALGNRSIIARSDSIKAFQQVSNIKHREWYRPFAPIVLENDVHLVTGEKVYSPYMTTAYKITNDSPIKYCCSVDKRSRIQTVKQDSFWGGVLEKLKQNGVFPSCLNTSFNLSGNPIVESIDDALKMFNEVNINTLVLGNYIVLKHYNNRSLRIDYDVEFRYGGKIKKYKKGILNITKYIDLIKSITKIKNIFFRNYFALNHEYFNWLSNGKKNTTIRFKYQSLEIPQNKELPLSTTKEFEICDFNDISYRDQNKSVYISKVVYSKYSELSNEDAINDGFIDLIDMKHAFRKNMYSNINDNDWVTIYHIGIKEI